MDPLSFTFIDVLVVVVILISAIAAAARGFVRESLSIVAWAAAAFAALFFGPALARALHGVLSGWGAVLVAYGAIFVIVVIPLSFISYRFAEKVHNSPVNGVDRSLGVVFGIVRGLALIAILYLVFSMIVPIPRQPRWVTQARFLPLIQSSSEVVLAMIPEQRVDEARETVVRQRPRRHRVVPEPRPERRAAARPRHKTETAQKTPKKSYGAAERQALDNLIKSTADSGGHQP